MMRVVVVDFFLIIAAYYYSSSPANAQSDVYMNSVELVSPSVYTFYWNYTNSNITGEIVVRTYGWVSFGITRRNSLEKSDLILAWITSSRTVFVDCYYTGSDVFSDALQNWQLLNAFERDGYTTIKFTRRIVLSDVDPEHDVDIDVGTPLVSYSWGATDPVRFINYNSSNLGFQPVPLLNAYNAINQNVETTYSLFFQMPDIELSNSKSEYFYCAPFSLPANTSIDYFHMTQFATNITSGNENYVYDWKIYLCPGLADTSTLPTDGECNPNHGSSNNSTLWYDTLTTQCSILGIMWANGNNYLQKFPVNAGYPFGYNTINSIFDTFVLRVHYVNLESASINTTDSTGVTIYYTPNLRKHDIGSLLLGGFQTWQGLTIPPGSKHLKVNYYCYDSCTNLIGNTTGIFVIANYLHTYNYGRKISTKIIRNEGEYMFVGRNSYYDSNYQYLLYQPNPILIQPGDELITSCTYDTTDSLGYVFGGTYELCYNLLYYYPAKLNISTCTSAPTISDWNTFVSNLRSINYLTIGGSLSPDLNTSTSILSRIAPINNYLRTKFQDFYYYTDYTQQCTAGTTANVSASSYSQITPLFYLNDYDTSAAASKRQTTPTIMLITFITTAILTQSVSVIVVYF